MNNLLISNTPHIRSKATTKQIMLDVCIALLPATVMGIVFFGLSAFLIVFLSVFSCVASEICYRLILKEKFKDILKKFDYTSLVTGLLLGLNLGTQVAWYVPILGGMFAIIVVKMLFGGTGKNFVNPAIAGRVFLIISFPAMMVQNWAEPSIMAQFSTGSVTAGQTVLGGILSTSTSPLSNLDLFLGLGVAGCIGETCKLALLVGFIYLIIRRVVNPIMPIIYIAVTGLVSSLMLGGFSAFLPSILSGGLFLGAIFMATDYVTTPNSLLGNIIYFALLGVITAVLRVSAGSEVVSYCILLMNFTVPLFDRYLFPKAFGFIKAKKTKKEGDK